MTFLGHELSVVKIQLSGREQKRKEKNKKNMVTFYSAIDANLEQWAPKGMSALYSLSHV